MYTDRGSAYRGKCKQCIAGDLRLLGELRPHREKCGPPEKMVSPNMEKARKIKDTLLDSLLPEIIKNTNLLKIFWGLQPPSGLDGYWPNFLA